MDDPVRERLLVLLDRLIGLTVQEKIDWKAAGDDPAAFYFNVESSGQDRIWIGSRDRDGRPPYDMVLTHDSKTTERLDWVYDATEDISAPWNEDLHRLYNMARESVLGPPTAFVNDILDKLPK